MMFARRQAPGIRRRISGIFLLLLVIMFSLLAVNVNFVVGRYIQTQADSQISLARDTVSRTVLGHRYQAPPDIMDFQDIMPRVNSIARRATFLTQVRALVIDESDRLVYPAQPELPRARTEEEDDSEIGVYDALMAHDIDLDDQRIQHVRHDERFYYLSCVPMVIGGDGGRDLRLVLYMDMTDVGLLMHTLDMVILIITLITVAIAAGFTLLMSNRIARPIRALSDFAEAIGKNNFARREIDCRERELIELADVMNRSAARLEAYDSEQKTFFQNVSHELRTPLMSIRGYAEGIAVGVFDDNAAAAGVIIQESEQLTKMVEELLYLSKADNITDQNERAVLDVREVLSSCGEALRGVALHEGKQIEYEFDEEPVLVFGAEKPLERAFSNLISNALRYGETAVVLRCHSVHDEAVICVYDDGEGIAKEDRERVFDRFYKGKHGKHGIGLSIVKAVVAQHGGAVAVVDVPKGALFEVRLRRCAANEGE